MDKTRKFAVIGLSTFGEYLTKYISDKGFQVMAMDTDEIKVDKVKNFVSKAVVADARHN